jgi:F0F1-type ATP synthase assembly protein I
MSSIAASARNNSFALMLYSATIFLSAFLLFQVQLICAKRLLPWYGGAPAVWTTCQFFFQIMLLAGYAYAHGITQFCRPRRQAIIHTALLLSAVAALAWSAAWGGVALLAPTAFKPMGTEQPIPLLLAALLTTVGLPFFALSATGPLLQRWHSQSAGPSDRTYRLYALSNAGSLLGLLSYPFGVERLFDLSHQAWIWTALFLVFCAGGGAVAWLGTFSSGPEDAGGLEDLPAADAQENSVSVPPAWRPWLWLMLAFSGSAMFLATTNQLCQEVAVVPFLWVMPLALYLLTFIICFDRPRWYSRRWMIVAAMAMSAAIFLQPAGGTTPILRQVVSYGALLTFFCMVSHGELMRLRPAPAKLTLYYLLIAAGGALGGAFVSLAAPLIFRGVWELHVTLFLGWAVFGVIWLLDHTSPFWIGGRRFFALTAGLLALPFAPFLIVRTPLRKVSWVAHNPWMATLAAAAVLAALACAVQWRSPLLRRPFWARALVLLMIGSAGASLYRRIGEARAGTVYAARNFHGVVRIVALKDRFSEIGAYKLVHGVTNHGEQFTDALMRDVPTAYYSPSSGIGCAAQYLEGLSRNAKPRQGLDFGLLGMGVGTIAAYAHSGDRVKFYEIDPIVIEVCGPASPYFTFLRDCAGSVSIVPGDARLSLESEPAQAASQRFDLLALDAFSGDAIPVHLLTKEAFCLYAAHLRDADSILAVNITNAYLELEPVIAANARALGFRGIRIDAPGDEALLRERSTWILLARNPDVFDRPEFLAVNARPLQGSGILFTDQYSYLFRVLR